MRYSSLGAAAALALLSLSTSLHGQRPDAQIDPRSLQLLASAKAAQSAGNLTLAAETLETALAVDPRNRAAFVTLGDVSLAQGLSGKAIRYYRGALALDPNDLAALSGQGEALVAKGAIERAVAICRDHGVKKAMLLPVSAPFHCSLMQPAANAMAEALAQAQLSAPLVPLYANVLAAPIADPDAIRLRLVDQVTGMVRWRESVMAMADAGVAQFIEFGAKVLGPMNKRTVEADTISIVTMTDIEAVAKAL